MKIDRNGLWYRTRRSFNTHLPFTILYGRPIVIQTANTFICNRAPCTANCQYAMRTSERTTKNEKRTKGKKLHINKYGRISVMLMVNNTHRTSSFTFPANSTLYWELVFTCVCSFVPCRCQYRRCDHRSTTYASHKLFYEHWHCSVRVRNSHCIIPHACRCGSLRHSHHILCWPMYTSHHVHCAYLQFIFNGKWQSGIEAWSMVN